MLRLKRLKWIAYALPVLGLVALELFRFFVLHSRVPHFWTSAIMIGLMFSGVVVFTYLLFRALEERERVITGQNRELADLRSRAEARARRVTALHEASGVMTSEVAWDNVLQKIADLSREIVPARYAAIVTLTPEGTIDKFITSGITAEERARLGDTPQGHGVLGVPIKTKQPLRLDDITSHPDSVGFPPHHPPMKRLLAIPTVYKGTPIGELYLANTAESPPFTQEDQDMLSLFANQAAIAMENARLYQRIQTMAVVDDRERIGRDLHDSIIQQIYAVGLTLEGIHDTLEESPSEAKERLDYAIGKLNETIRDIRNYIFQLKPHVYEGKSLQAGLDDLVAELRVNSLLDVELKLDGRAGRALPADQTVETLKIVREALTNIVKHARATRVTLDARSPDGKLVLCIQDNGVGFDSKKKLGAERRGLRNMQQRAEALDGDLAVQSEPGRGTMLTLTVPLPKLQEKEA